MTRLRNGLAAAALCLLAAGCDNSLGPSTITAGAASTLHADVLALTQAVANHQWNAADHALAQLRTDLTAAAAGGGMSAARAQAIRADVATITADLAARRDAITPSPMPSTSTTSKAPKPTKAPPPQPQPKPPKHGHGDNGQGKGGGD